MTRKASLVLPVLAVTGAAALSVMAATTSSAAGSCSPTVTISGPSGGNLLLSPDPAHVTRGGCVAFSNHSAGSVTVTVSGSSYHVTVGKGSTTSSANSYQASSVGSFRVTAQGALVGNLDAKGSGTIDVSSPSSPSPSPTHHHKKPSPKPSHHQSSRPVTGPDVAPKPHHHHHAKHPSRPGPSPTVSLPPIPPLSTVLANPAPGTNPKVAPSAALPLSTFSEAPPISISPSPSPAASTVESSDGTSRGLPAAIAAVVILGAGFALFRVLRART